MACGYFARIMFQVLNLIYFAHPKSYVTIWLPFPFAALTCLPPIGFTMFAFRYFEVTTVTQISIESGTNQKQVRKKINCFKLAIIIELAIGITLQSAFVIAGRLCAFLPNDKCSIPTANTIKAWSFVPNIFDQLTFLIVVVIFGISLYRIRQQVIIHKGSLNNVMCFHYFVLLPAFSTEIISVVAQSLAYK